jgi:hypothetical protein
LPQSAEVIIRFHTSFGCDMSYSGKQRITRY